MDLKEYIQIIKKNFGLLAAIIVMTVIVGFFYAYLNSKVFETSLSLNITRVGSQETADFKYDDFYRLQADEKFAETVVEWLKSPRIVSDIYNVAGIENKSLSLRQLSKALRPEKLSSQLISVHFSSPDEKTSRKIARAIVEVVSRTTQNLNQDQKENTWFKIMAGEPVTVRKNYENKNVLILSLLVGAFLGFWTVMIKYYLK